jgi:hypothetical protein
MATPAGSQVFSSSGRWFAATELKFMLDHLVTMYDIKLTDEGRRPPLWIRVNCVPNLSEAMRGLLLQQIVDMGDEIGKTRGFLVVDASETLWLRASGYNEPR